MSNIQPDDLYNQLCENASTRKKKTLALVHEVCKKQSEAEVKDFSLGTIAALMSDKGGLSEQALRNKNAEPYRLLINNWAEYSNTTTKKPKKQTTTTRDEKSRTFSSNSQRSHILRTSSRSIRLILSSIVSLAVWLKWTRTI